MLRIWASGISTLVLMDIDFILYHLFTVMSTICPPLPLLRLQSGRACCALFVAVNQKACGISFLSSERCTDEMIQMLFHCWKFLLKRFWLVSRLVELVVENIAVSVCFVLNNCFLFVKLTARLDMQMYLMLVYRF